MRAELIEDTVEEILLSLIGELRILKTVTIPGDDHTDELKELELTLDDLLASTAGKSAAVKNIYEGRISKVEAKITELSALPVTAAETKRVETDETYREVWESSDFSERRRLLVESGIRVEAAKTEEDQEGFRLHRPNLERTPDDVALMAVVRDGVQVALFVPPDVAARAGQPEVTLKFSHKKLFK